MPPMSSVDALVTDSAKDAPSEPRYTSYSRERTFITAETP
jgi:hypothetical protein